jgi:ssDNA-binding Zn-finger/Zn-ribbon topoisomerase 1
MSEHIVKACPRCGQPLEIKRNSESGKEFLGCSGWRLTGCSFTAPLPEAIVLRRQGQRDLFDEEESGQ